MQTDPRVVVLDTSVGVKWIKPEDGRAAALALLQAHRIGEVRLVVASHFISELTAVAVRRGGPKLGKATYDAVSLAQLTAVGLDDRVASEAFVQCAKLGCSFYDALPAAIASLIGATLCSADARAHCNFPGVELI